MNTLKMMRDKNVVEVWSRNVNDSEDEGASSNIGNPTGSRAKWERNVRKYKYYWKNVQSSKWKEEHALMFTARTKRVVLFSMNEGLGEVIGSLCIIEIWRLF